MLKVMSYNIRCINDKDDVGLLNWKVRKEYVIKTIRESSPDIIGFQEATKIQLEYLIDQLSDYGYEYKFREVRENPESGPVFYKKERFDKIDSWSYWLSETPNFMSKSWNSCCFRMASTVFLTDKETGKRLCVCNTHLDHRSEEARVKGIDVIINDSKEKCFDTPMILMADFNAHRDSVTMDKVYENFDDPSLVSSADMINHVTYQGYFRRDEPERIDFFATRSLKSLKYLVIEKTFKSENNETIYSSDHFPIYLECDYQ